MKKALFALIPALLFASCSFWNEPVEEFFSYWSSEAFITDSSVKVPNQSDKAGVPSVSSDTDSEIILKMSNPKSFRFIMPSAGNSEMIRFKGLETQPSAGTDYKLEQLSSETLKLTYKTAFLQQHEWGNGDLGATLTLFADDGRKFKKPYGFNLKANTPPPTPTAVLAQTAASSFSYVLCFKVPDMDVMVNGERLHKDIAQIEINGTKYPLTVESTDFRKPDDPHFILAGGVTQLTEPHSAPVPAGAWVLYYNTGVPLGAGHQAYTVKLKDDKDLVSNTLETGTTLNEPPAEIVTVTAGEQTTGSGNSDTDPFIIKGAASAPEAQIKIENTAAGTTVHCTVTKVVGTAAPARYDGNPVTFPLGLDSADEKTYKVEYYTDGIGYKSNSVKTKYYKVLKQHTVTFNANGGTYTGGTTYTALVAHTMTATAPAAAANPTRTGYTFGSWYKEAACTTQWNFATDTVTGDITLYAQWNPASGTGYKVEHYQEKTDGVGQYPASPHETDNLTGTTGANISVTPKTYPGFEFDKQEPASPSIAADGSTVVKVYYKRKSITVTFNLNGGNIGGSMTAQTRTGRFGTALTAPANPVKTGYTFSSWQPVGAAPLLSSTFPASDAAYTAQWVANTNTPYKVKHLKQNITGSDYTEVTGDTENLQGTTGTNAAVTTKTYTGFETGTYTPATIAADGTTVIEVRYNRTQYTVTFNANGGTPAPSTLSVRYEGKVTAPSTLTKQGYDFDKWYKDPSFTNEWNFTSDTVIGAAMLYAKWNPRNDTQYIVKHLKQNITGSGYTEVTGETENLQGTTDAAPTVTPKTYTGFQAGSYTPTTIAADGSTVIEVRYNRKVHTVTFNANGGTPAPQSQNVRYEGKVSTPSTISKTGYTFGGWYKSYNYTGTAWNFASNTVSDNTTLYAKWTANTYKVRFNSNGGSGSMSDQSFTYDEASKPLSQNTFTKTDYRFTGWATRSSGSKMYDNQQSVNNLTAEPNGTFNLYAVWVPLPKVRFKVEGGIGGKLKCT